jgi:hypothetical protein
MRKLSFHHGVFLVLATVAVSCGTDRSDPATGTSTAAVSGCSGCITPTRDSTDMPAAPVGALFPAPAPGGGAINIQDPANSFCSGTLIDRDLVLSAAHCWCNRGGLSSPNFAGMTFGVVSADNTRWFPPQPRIIVGMGIAGVFVRAYNEICNDPNPKSWSFSRDVAIIRLTGKFSEVDVPRVMPVYTSGDLPDRVAMYSTGGAPWQVTGYGFPFNDRVTGTLQSFQPITFDGTSSCGFLGWATCPAGRIEFLLGDARSPRT